MAESLEEYALAKKEKQRGSINKVGIVGCGIVGQEICRLVSKAGLQVVFVDVTEERVKEIMNEIDQQLTDEINHWGLTQSDKKTILSRIRGTTDYGELKDCSIVHESVNSRTSSTNLYLCREVFKNIELAVPSDTIIASNNSSLMISEIAESLQYQDRAIGMHFINPVSFSKVVEISRGANTSQQTVEKIVQYAKMIGKNPVVIDESPGHISTRLVVTLINEACELLMEGVGSVECIDKVMRQGYGLPYGPFEMADRLGLDKVMKWMDNLYGEYSHRKFKPNPILKRLVRLRHYGRRTGIGFYRYEEGQPVESITVITEFKTHYTQTKK